jgi:molybdopterin/thiamine biosynthesis adenylyltransferase
MKLEQRSCLIVGAGGLGSPVALALTAAGVGRIGIIDDDVIDISNLQRQILHATADVGRQKVASAAAVLGPRIEAIEGRVLPDTAVELFTRYDVVCDGSDNFGTRFLCNDAAILARRPLVFAGVLRFQGQAMTILPGQTACYRCLFEAPPPEGEVPSCSEAGILGAVAGALGAVQASGALQLLSGHEPALAGTLLTLDLLEWKVRRVPVKRDSACPACGDAPNHSLDATRYAPAICADGGSPTW